MTAKACPKGTHKIRGRCIPIQRRKVIAIVDHEQQYKEKNISFRDYPMLNSATERKLRKPFSYYYNSWAEYIIQRKRDGKDWKVPKET